MEHRAIGVGFKSVSVRMKHRAKYLFYQNKTPRQVLWDTVDYHTYREKEMQLHCYKEIWFWMLTEIWIDSSYRCRIPECLSQNGTPRIYS